MTKARHKGIKLGNSWNFDQRKCQQLLGWELTVLILDYSCGYTIPSTWHMSDRGGPISKAKRPYGGIWNVTAVLLQTDSATRARMPVSDSHPNPLAVPLRNYDTWGFNSRWLIACCGTFDHSKLIVQSDEMFTLVKENEREKRGSQKMRESVKKTAGRERQQ